MKVIGIVVRGDGRGRTLGWPTANIEVPEGLDAADGVYAAVVGVDGTGDGESGTFAAMANLGVKPTFGGGARVLELHLFDFSGDLYGRRVTARLVERIRPEQRFATAEELRAQIEKDEIEVKNILKCT